MSRTRGALMVVVLVAASCSGNTSESTTTSTTQPPPPRPTTSIVVDTTPPTTGAAGTPTTSTVPSTSPDAEPGNPPPFRMMSDEPVVVRSDSVRSTGFVAPGAVVLADGVFHMFSGGNGAAAGDSSVAYYTSLDGVGWVPGSPTPVLQSSQLVGPQSEMMGHTAVQDGRGRWVIYFRTVAGPDRPGFIGRATAVSPIGPWAVDPEPVLSPGPAGAWDAAGLSRPQVVDTGTGLVMFYAGVDGDGVARIGMATSPDGETWTKHDDPTTNGPAFALSDPVLVPQSAWEAGRVLRPAVALSPDGFVMLYQNGAKYGLAFSSDGIAWTRFADNPVVTGEEFPDPASSLFEGALIYRDGTYFFYVEAGSEQGTDVFLMTRDGTLRDPAHIEGRVVETLVPRLEIATGGVTLDAAGNLYVADFGTGGGTGGSQLFRVSPAGEVDVFADDPLLVGASGNTVAPDGTVYQSSFSGGRVVKISPAGEVELLADEGVQGPVGVVVDPEGDGIFVADCSANTILRVDPDGNVATFASDPLLRCPNGLTGDGAGTLYVANFTDGRVLAVSPEGEVTSVAVVPGDNNGHLAYFDGALYVVGRGAHRIFEVSLDGEVTPIAGSGERGLEDGFAIRASLSLPNGIAVAPDGTMYVNHVATEAGTSSSPTTVRVIRPPG